MILEIISYSSQQHIGKKMNLKLFRKNRSGKIEAGGFFGGLNEKIILNKENNVRENQKYGAVTVVKIL